MIQLLLFLICGIILVVVGFAAIKFIVNNLDNPKEASNKDDRKEDS